MRLLIDLSPHPGNAEFVYRVLAHNRGAFDSLAVPPIMRWHLFPHDSPAYLGELTHTARALTETLDDECDKRFCKRIAGDEAQRVLLCQLAQSNKPACARLAVMRALKLLDAYPRESTVLVSDPDLLGDLMQLDDAALGQILPELRSLSPMFFAVQPDPVEAAMTLEAVMALAREKGHRFTGADMPRLYERQDTLRQYEQLLRSGIADRIVSLSRDALLHAPRESLQALLERFGMVPARPLSLPDVSPRFDQPLPLENQQAVTRSMAGLHVANPFKPLYDAIETLGLCELGLDTTGRLGLLEAAESGIRAGAPVRAIGRHDKLYSLDTTSPQDFEPVTMMDFSRANLTEIADHFKTDKGTIKHRYTEIYERYLGPLRGKPVRLLEIGVACGASLKMWSRYFGPESRITGVDIRPECAGLCRGYENIDIRIGDASTLSLANAYDIIIDDGSHVSEDMVRTWRNLWRQLSPGGLYIIEDLKCTHDPQYINHFPFSKSPESFARGHFVAWLDEMMRRMDTGMSDVDFVHYYPQLMVIGKSEHAADDTGESRPGG